MKAASPRIALMPMGFKRNDSFLYSSPVFEKNGWSHVSWETGMKRLFILLLSMSNMEPCRPVTGLKGLYRVMRERYPHNHL